MSAEIPTTSPPLHEIRKAVVAACEERDVEALGEALLLAVPAAAGFMTEHRAALWRAGEHAKREARAGRWEDARAIAASLVVDEISRLRRRYVAPNPSRQAPGLN